jgi:hypothetical protein
MHFEHIRITLPQLAAMDSMLPQLSSITLLQNAAIKSIALPSEIQPRKYVDVLTGGNTLMALSIVMAALERKALARVSA